MLNDKNKLQIDRNHLYCLNTRRVIQITYKFSCMVTYRMINTRSKVGVIFGKEDRTGLRKSLNNESEFECSSKLVDE